LSATARKGLRALPTTSELVAVLRESLCPLPAVVALIDRAIVDEPPIAIRDGGLIKLGYHAELDQLKDAGAEKYEELKRDLQPRIAELEQKARAALEKLKP